MKKSLQAVLRRPRYMVFVAAVASFVPVLACLVYVRTFGVSVVYSDQWEMVTLFRRADLGLLDFSDLLRLHNEHRFFFPRLVMLALGLLTGWNNTAEMYLTVVLLATSTGIMFFAFRRSFGDGCVLLFVPIALLVLTLRQHLNLLWGYQITFTLTQLAAVASLYALYLYSSGRTVSGRRLAFAGAVLFAIVASGSSVQGLTVWVAGLLTFALTISRGREGPVHGASYRGAVLWLLAGVSVWILYFRGYRSSGRTSSTPSAVLSEPVSGLEHGISVIGASITFDRSRVMVVGVLLMVSLLSTVFFLSRRGSRELLGKYSFWVSLCAFSLLVLALVTLGRYSNGITGALASRYVTFSVLLVVGLYALAVALWREYRGHFLPKLQLAAIFLLILLSQALYLDNAYARGVISEREREAVVRTVSSLEDRTDEEIENDVKFNAQSVRTRAKMLEQLGYNVHAG